MPDSSFPERPGALPLRPTPIALVVPQEPLAAIRDVLSLSIHEVVNDPGHKCRVLDFYRIVRKIENEAWLRRSLQERRDEDWIAAHLSRRVPDDRVG